MIEAYRIGVEMMLGGDLAEGIRALIPGMERLNGLLATANADATGLATALAGVGKAASGINRVAEAMERLQRATAAAHGASEAFRDGAWVPPYPAGGGGGGPAGPRLLPNGTAGRDLMALGGADNSYGYNANFRRGSDGQLLLSGPSEDASFAGEEEPRFRLNPNGRSKAPRDGKERQDRHTSSHALNAIVPLLLTGEAFEKTFGASFEVGGEEAGMLANGWTPEQVTAARKAAQEQQVATPGSSIGGNLKMLGDMTAVLRAANGSPDAEAALGALPGIVRDLIVLSAHGHGDGLNEIFKAVQAGDLRGVISKPGSEETDPGKLMEFVHSVMMANTLTKGRVSPQQILQFTRTGGASAAMMGGGEFFGENLALLEGMGSQAAAALQGFNRQFGAGRMSKAAEEELEIGFPSLAGHYHDAGIKQVMVDPGAFMNSEALARSPLQTIHDQLLPGLDRILRTRYQDFDTWTPEKRQVFETQEAARISSTNTGAKLISEVLRLYPQMTREAEGFKKQMGIDVYGLETKNNPDIRLKALTAALNGLEVSLGETAMNPAIATINSITNTFNSVAQTAGAYPTTTRIALESLAAGLTALGVSAVIAAIGALGAPAAGLAAVAAGLTALWAAIKEFGGLGELVKSVENGAKSTLGALGKSLASPYQGGSGDLPNGGAFTPMAYHPAGPAHGPTIHLTAYTQLDGRTVAKSVTMHQVKMMGGQVSGTLRPDPSIAPHYGAHLIEA